MAGEGSNTRLPVFNGKNFGLWKKQVQIHLKVKELNEALVKVEDDKKDAIWLKKDNEAQAILFSCMDQSVALKVASCDSATEIWSRLQEIYESTSAAMVAKVFEEYHSYRKSSGDDMATHVSKVEALASHLETVGQKQTDVSIMSRLLHSLPESHNALKEAWESVDPAKQTKEALISRLLSHTATTGESSKDVALVAGSNYGSGSKFGQDRKKKGKCYHCGKFGHWARDCRSKPKEDENGIALVIGQGGEKSNSWVIDSGASKHTCCRREWFVEMSPWNEKLQVGNQAWVEAIGRGTINLICNTNFGPKKLSLKDVLYIPSMSQNLFSTGRAASNGATTVFKSSGCEVIHNGRLVARGFQASNGLCHLDIKKIDGSAMITVTKRSIENWHDSLGHVDSKIITEMVNNKSADGLEIVEPSKTPGCSACAEGKATRASHTMEPSFRPTEVGERVDMDLIGPINEESLGKKRYILLAKDNFSDYSHVYMIGNKSEVAEKLQNYIGVFESESNRKIRSIVTDNGSEFNNHQVQALCDLEHIRLCFSAPYTPQQNGVAERNNRTIIEVVRTLLAGSELPKSLWAEATNTAVYIRNRVIKHGEKMTPYEKFCGRKPGVSHIVPFGTQVYALINDRHLGKFDPKSEPAFVVGFTERSNSYRILVRESMKIKISCDIIFREHRRGIGFQRESTSDAHSTVEVQHTAPKQPMSSDLLSDYFEGLLQRHRGMEDPSSIDQSTPRNLSSNRQQNNSEFDVESPSFSTITQTSQPQLEEPPVLQSHERDVTWSTAVGSPNASQDTPSRQSPGCMSCTQPRTPQQHPANGSPFRGREIPRTPPRRLQEEGQPQVPERTTSRVVTRSFGNQLSKLFVAQTLSGELLIEPTTFQQAVTGPNRSEWIKAIESELKAHEKNATWVVADRPKVGTLLSAKWVFKIKRDEYGNIDKFKARLVARGFQQKEGIDYFETYAPVARSESIRTLLAIAAMRNLNIERFDVSTAFLNGLVSEDIYIEPPEGVSLSGKECLKLEKALYGLKQAPKEWNSVFNEAVKSLGFESISADLCVYRKQHPLLYLSIYVDDGLIIGDSKESCREVIENLNKHFDTNLVHGEVFLGMQIQTSSSGIFLSQQRYVIDVLHRYKMEDCNGVSTPLVDSKILFENDGDVRADIPYRAAIGGLLYVALATRPDILFPTILLSKFNENPQTKHWSAVKRIISYLKHTQDHGLLFKCSEGKVRIDVYSDADWAGDVENRRSTSGVLIMINRSPVVFASRQQTTVAQSSTEAELIAACEAVKELIWLLNLLKDLGIEHEAPTLFVDNKSTISLIMNNDIKRRSKHIDVKYHLVRIKYQEGLFELEHIESKLQCADFLTKAIGRDQLKSLLSSSGIMSKHEAGFEGECRKDSNSILMYAGSSADDDRQAYKPP